MARIENYQDVIKLAYQSEAYWQRSKLQMNKGFRWYNLDIPVQTPKGKEWSAPPTAPTLVNDAADHLAGTMPKFDVKALRETQKADEDRTRVQMSLNGMYDRICRKYGKDLHRELAIQGGWSGMMCARVGLRDNWNYDHPTWKDFYWQPIDPRWVFPDPGSNGEEFVIIRMRKSVGQVRKMWPDWEGQWYMPGSSDSFIGQFKPGRLTERLPDTSMVDWIEYWDDEVKCFIANGHPVFQERFGRDILPHMLGINPIIIRPAGYGNDGGEPQEQFRSMLYWVFHLLELEAKLLVQYKWIIEDTAWPTWLAPESMRDLDITPGTINYVPNGDDIKNFKAVREDAVEPKAVVDLLAWVQGQIEKATYPVVLKGQAPNGIKAGYPIAILSTQAKLKFAAPSAALRSMLMDLSTFTLAIIKNRIDKSVETIDGRMLEPTDYDKYEGRIEVNLEPSLPTDKAASLSLVQFAVGSLNLPREVALRELGYDDPLELQEQRMAEDLVEDPRVKQIMGMHLADELSPEYAAALNEVIGPAVEQQKLQQTMQDLTAQVQQMQAQMQMWQMQPQFQQMQAQMRGMPPPQQQAPQMFQRPMPQQGAPQQGPPAGTPTVSGGPGGTNIGQNLMNPNGSGTGLPQANPLTAMTGIAREMKAERSITDLSAQENVYGNGAEGSI